MLSLISIVSMSAMSSSTCRRSVGSLRPFIAKSDQVLSLYFSSPESTRTTLQTHPFASSSVDEVPSSPTTSEISPSADAVTGEQDSLHYLQALTFTPSCILSVSVLNQKGRKLSPKSIMRSVLLNPANSSLGVGQTCILKLRGLPFSATEGEIGEWLADSSLGIPHVTSDK
jgi:hypothetical protein